MLKKLTLLVVPIAAGAVVVGLVGARRARVASKAAGPVLSSPMPGHVTAQPAGIVPASTSKPGPQEKRKDAGRPAAAGPAPVIPSPARREAVRRHFQGEMREVGRSALQREGPAAEADGYANWFYRQRSYPAARIPSGALVKGLKTAIQRNGGLHGSPGDPTPPPGPPALPTWITIGPSTIPDGQTDNSTGGALDPVSGRLTAIAVDPADSNIVYAGGAQGGVWKTTNALASSPIWTPMTDHQASLAIGAIAIDPVNSQIVYAGTGEPNGSCDSYYGAGLLRSSDGGLTWTVLGGGPDGPFTNQSISKVLIDPNSAGSTSSTTIWVSTALGFLSSGTEQCALAPGVWNGAVWRSDDSGATWALQDVPTGATLPNARIHDMALDPTDSNVLYVAVRSVPTAADGGVWKSTNAKGAPATFAKVAGGFPDTTAASPGIRRITLGIGGPAAHNTLYAALESSAGSDALWGLLKTTDGGATWSNIDNGANGTCDVTSGGSTVTRDSGPSFTAAMIGHRIIVNGQFSRTVSAVADGDHLTVAGGTFTATLAATSWSVASYPNFCDGQCFYDMTVGVDPADSAGDVVYVGGNPAFLNTDPADPLDAHYLWRSTDGGNIWRSISEGNGVTGSIHTDDHAIAFDASATPSRLYDGNDGGIWRSDDQGASWTTMNTNIAITQFQSVALHPSEPSIILGGTQDNGTNLQNPASQPLPKWFHSDFGDGGQALIDQSDPKRMFHTYFNGPFNFMGPSMSTDGGVSGPGSWTFVGSYYGYGSYYYNGMDPTEPVSFYAPIAKNPAFSPNVVYFGSDHLYRSPDPLSPLLGTPSWTEISPRLTKAFSYSNYLSAIGVFPKLLAGKEVVYTGASDGRVEVSSDIDGSGVSTWNAIDAAPLPNRWVTQVLAPGEDATGNTAYVTFSGFNVDTPGVNGHVFRTTDGLDPTPIWTDLSGDLPDLPVNAIAIDPTTTPNILYVGTDIGVFQSLDDGVHWLYLSNGHPVVSVFGLERSPTTGQLVSSTHGRGMFQLISNGLPDTTAPVCGGSVAGPDEFDGSALDAGANDTGVASIVLEGGAANLVISSITYSSPGAATYVVNTVDHCLPGSGTVLVSDYAGNTCEEAVSLTGDPAPSAVITAPSTVCSHSTTDVASVPDAGGGAAYAWTISNGAITAGQGTNSVTFSANGSGTITLGVTVTSGLGCSTVGSVDISINGSCGNFFTLPPCRVVDTRGADAPAVNAGGDRTFFLNGKCGIPSTAREISVNVTVTQPTAAGSFDLFEADIPDPQTPIIDYGNAQTRANNAVITLGPGGSITVHSNQTTGTAQFILDVNGYFE
jgi:PKD-like domain